MRTAAQDLVSDCGTTADSAGDAARAGDSNHSFDKQFTNSNQLHYNAFGFEADIGCDVNENDDALKQTHMPKNDSKSASHGICGHASASAPGSGGSASSTGGGAPADARRLMERALIVPGMLHICHNLLADVDTALTGWEQFWQEAKNIAALLNSRQRRDRLLATCFHGSYRYASVAKLIADWSLSLHEERWGDIVHFLKAARPALLTLRRTWNEERFNKGMLLQQDIDMDTGKGASNVQALGGTAQEQPETEPQERLERGRGTFSAGLLTQTIKSNKWFAYLDMVVALHDIPTAVSNWAESCACHGGRGKQLQLRVDAAVGNSAVEAKSCPLKGCRLPELVTGGIEKVMNKAMTSASASLNESREFLTDEDWSSLVSDFENARVHALFVLGIKTDFAKRLPWKLAGLAATSENDAAQCYRESLILYDAMEPQLQSQSHVLAKLFLSRTGPWRTILAPWSQLHPGSDSNCSNSSDAKATAAMKEHGRQGTEQFQGSGSALPAAVKLLPCKMVSDSRFTAWPLKLQEEVAALRFVPIVERSVERLHSIVNWATKHARRKRPAQVSLALRSHEIVELIDGNGHQHHHNKHLSAPAGEPAIAKLAKALMCTLKVVETPAIFGFAQHPGLLAISAAHANPCQQAAEKKVRCRQLAEAIQNIVYRCDIDSQFVGRDEAKQKHEQASKLAATKLLQPAKNANQTSSDKDMRQTKTQKQFSVSALKHHCFGDHLVAVARSQWRSQSGDPICSSEAFSGGSAPLFSLPKTLMQHVQPVSQCLDPQGNVDNADAGGVSGAAGTDAENGINTSIDDHVFLSVLPVYRPHLMKTVAAGPSNRKLQKKDIIVAIHSLLGTDGDSGQRLVSVRPFLGSTLKQPLSATYVLKDLQNANMFDQLLVETTHC